MRKANIAKAVLDHTKDIISNQFGNYALQYVLENGPIEYAYKALECIQGSLIRFCTQKYSSNVLEKLILKNDYRVQMGIVNEITHNPKHLTAIAQHRFGIYVIRRLLTSLLPQYNIIYLEFAQYLLVHFNQSMKD